MPAGLLNCYPDEPIKGSLGATNGIISSFMSHDIITYLAGGSPKSLNTRIGLDFDGLHITETKLSQRKALYEDDASYGEKTGRPSKNRNRHKPDTLEPIRYAGLHKQDDLRHYV